MSIQYINKLLGYITGFAATGIAFRCVITGYELYTAGLEVKEILIRLQKQIRAGIMLILITAIIAFFKRYYI